MPSRRTTAEAQRDIAPERAAERLREACAP